MSSVKAVNFQHPSSSDANIQLGSDGSVVLPAGFTGGLGTNVVQTVKTDSFSSTATTMTAITGLSATITPTSASSKILVVFHSMIGHSSSNGTFFGFLRGATAIGRGNDGDATVYFAPNTSNYGMMASATYLDSPATTSAVTYSLEGKTTAGTFYVNRPGAVDQEGIATLTLIEVAA